MRACPFDKSIILVFLHLKNANTIHYKKSLYSIVIQKNVHKMSSVHGSSVLTVTMKISVEKS